MRRGINQQTLEKICARVPARAMKLAQCLKILQEYEEATSSIGLQRKVGLIAIIQLFLLH
jgi:hypothetical protein